MGALIGYEPGGYYQDKGSGKGDIGRDEGAAGHILELTIAGTPEISGGIRTKNSAEILDRVKRFTIYWGLNEIAGGI